MKRKINPVEPRNDGLPIKRRKITTAAELEKPTPTKKKIILKGKARLRLKIKEQSICITQKNHREKQLTMDIERLKHERKQGNHILGVVDRHWQQLTSDLELIVTDLCENLDLVEGESVPSLFSLMSTSTSTPETDPDDSSDEEGEDWRAVEEQVENRVEKTKSLARQIAESLQLVVQTRKTILERLSRGDAQVDSHLQEELNRLTKQVDRLRVNVQKKHKELAAQRQRISEQEDTEKTSEQHVQYLEEQNDRIATAYKRLIRTRMYQDTAKPPSVTTPKVEEKPASEPAKKKDEVSKEEEPEPFDTALQGYLAEIQFLKEANEKSGKEIVRLQSEKLEIESQVQAHLKQYQGKDLEIVLLKSDKELQEDALHQTKASHASSLGVLENAHKAQVGRLEKKLAQSTKDILALRQEKAALIRDKEKVNIENQQALITTLESRDTQQQTTINKLRTENERMREQIGNKDLQVKLKELQSDIQVKEVEIKSLKALIQTPDCFTQAMYKSQINRLKHKARLLEGEIHELKQNTQAKKLHSLERSMDILGAEVDRSAKEYAQLQTEKERRESEHIQHIKHLTDTNAHLHNLNASYNHSLKRLNEERVALQQAIETQKVVQVKQKAYIASLQEQLKTLGARNESLSTNANASQQTSQILRDHLVSLAQKYYHLRTEMELQSEVNTKLRGAMEKKHQQILEAQAAARSFQEKYNRQKSTYRELKGTVKNGAGVDTILRKQHEISRRRLLCGLCTHRRKDTIIVKCLHMFCSKCVNNHFASRNRKCPQCKHSFGKADIRDVSFNFSV